MEPSLDGIVFYRAWLVLEPDAIVSAYPSLGAIAVSEQEIFRDTCSDKMFFGKMRSQDASAVRMPVVALSFETANSAEIVAIASGTSYKVHKNYRQRYLFQANVNQDGAGKLEPTQRLNANYKIDITDQPKVLCDNISLRVADEYVEGNDVAITPDGTFQVNRSFYGKRIVAQMAVTLIDDVVVSTNQPLPAIELNLVGIKDEVAYYVCIENVLPVIEAFDADAQNITLRLAFDDNNLTICAVNLPTET